MKFGTFQIGGSTQRVQARLTEASKAYAAVTRGAVASLNREDIGWSRWGDEDATSDVVSLTVIKEHSLRARRLAAYNPLVKRGIGIRNAYMWSEIPRISGIKTPETAALYDTVLSRTARARDEAAFCTDGIVLYTVRRTDKRVAPVPLSRIRGIARALDATDEADIFAFLIDPVPVSDTLSTEEQERRKPEWHVVNGKDWAPVKDEKGYRTVHNDRVVYEMVNRQIGEQWGKPELMGAVYWAQAYKEFLEASHVMTKALARIAFKVTSATAKQQQAVIQQMSNAQGIGGLASLGAGQEFTAVSKAGAGIDFGAGTPLASMVASALDVPLSVLLTDGSAGGRQGAETALEDPTFKAFEFRRQIHKSLIQKIFLALGRKVEVELAPLSNELIQRWGQVVTLGLQNGILHKTEARSLFLDRLQPINARPINDLPVSEEILAAKSLADPNAVQDSVAKKSNSRTGVGAMSDGTNANRDEAGGETLA